MDEATDRHPSTNTTDDEEATGSTATATVTATTTTTLLGRLQSSNNPPNGSNNGESGRWTTEQWDAFLVRLSSHPDEAADSDRHGHCPLHLMLLKMSSVPVCVVRALCDANPRALFEPDRFGFNVLHLAADNPFVGVEAVSFFLGLHRKNEDGTDGTLFDDSCIALASGRDRSGRIPLHSARDPATARALVDAYPAGLAVRDMNGMTPLGLVVRLCRLDVVPTLVEGAWRHRVGRGCVVFDDFDNCGDNAVLACQRWLRDYYQARRMKGTNLLNEDEGERCLRERFWRALTSVLQVAYCAEMGYREFVQEPLLCCAVGLSRHVYPDVLSLIIADRPGEVMARDGRGRTPLHVATSCSNAGWGTFETLLASEGFKAAARMADSGTAGGEGLGLGRLPLHLAAERGCYERTTAIAKAEPRALSTMDSTTKMYPFMMAALADGGSVNAVFSLLREVPNLLMHYIPFEM